MTEIWYEKYRPKKFDDYIGNQINLSKVDDWLKNFAKPDSKKILLLSGPPGIGKTTLSHLILNKYGYVAIEFNSSDIRGGKNISDVIDKYINYHSVLDLFCGGKKPSGLIMDEIDTLCSGGGDKGGMTEFLNLLKAKKDPKTKNLRISSPIICTFNDFNDKKLKDLRSLSLEVRLSKPSKQDLLKLSNRIIETEGMKIDEEALYLVVANAEEDYRRLTTILYDLYMTYCKNESSYEISVDEVSRMFDVYSKKDVDTQIFTSSFQILNKPMSFQETAMVYSMDAIMMPVMTHENYPMALRNRKMTLAERIRDGCEINRYLSYGDLFQTAIYERQAWELLDYAGMGCLRAHWLADKPKIGKDEIVYTNLMSSITTRGANKKMLNGMHALLNINLNITELQSFALLVEYLLFGANDIGKAAELMKIYGISANDDLDNLLKVIRTTTENEKKITSKMRNELNAIIDPISISNDESVELSN